jgi:hypothetical protein
MFSVKLNSFGVRDFYYFTPSCDPFRVLLGAIYIEPHSGYMQSAFSSQNIAFKYSEGVQLYLGSQAGKRFSPGPLEIFTVSG